MGILEFTSSASLWRDYDYFKEKRVLQITETNDACYKALVSGNSDTPYQVEINIAHPRKSTCNCPHADGKRIICKHMVAVYFTVRPFEAERIYREAIQWQQEEEQRQEEEADRLVKKVHSMKKNEVCQALLELLFDGPEWQYDQFVREYLDE